MKNELVAFALLGVGGYIAPRHMRAIHDIGGTLVAAHDPKDSVGILDQYFPDALYYRDFERFSEQIDRWRSGRGAVEFVSICSPNHMHAAHCRFAMRNGAIAICEKPLVLEPIEVDELASLEEATGRRVYTILQLRLHPAVRELKRKIDSSGGRYQVELTYITSRGQWYHESWKGDANKSGGVATNIGVHFFDLLYYLFGRPVVNIAHARTDTHAAGYLEFERADVRWFLSVSRGDLPADVVGKKTTFRSLLIDGEQFEFSDGFAELHTESYREIVAGRGFPLSDVRPSIEVVSAFRHAQIDVKAGRIHPKAAELAP